MKPVTTGEEPKKSRYLLIGDPVPDSLTLTDSNGRTRSLLSYKGPLDVMVAEFLSLQCPYDQAAWRDLKLLYEDYKEWRVSFVGISTQPGETARELAESMSKAGLTYSVLRDEDQRAAKALHVMAVPEILVIDEWGRLRYRGPLHDAMRFSGKRPHAPYARMALEAVIGHTEAVPNAEPGGFIGCPLEPNVAGTGNNRD